MNNRRLIIFDCDGTLADSQHTITTAMDVAFESLALTPPGRARTLSIVGLSLPEAMAALAPGLDAHHHVRLAQAYREAAQVVRLQLTEDPLYPGIDAVVRVLAATPGTTLAMATGKSLRGVHRLITHHHWNGLFATLQTADDNPSKPHPGMLLRALAETGHDASDAIMVGDTTYDMTMARAAGVAALGVAWGYHSVTELTQSGVMGIAEDAPHLLRLLGHG